MSIEDLRKQGILDERYEEYISLTLKTIEEEGLENQSTKSTPIPPEVMDKNGKEVYIAPEVADTFDRLIQEMNVSGAKERGFILIGDETEDYILIRQMLDVTKESEETEVDYDGEKLFKYASEAKQKGRNFVSLTHTHPIVSESNKKETVAGRMKPETKERLGIREPGLNISGADIANTYIFKQQIESKIGGLTVGATIIMNNGDIVMLNPNGFTLMNNIMRADTLEPMQTPQNIAGQART